jgi:hypothetical protein
MNHDATFPQNETRHCHRHQSGHVPENALRGFQYQCSSCLSLFRSSYSRHKFVTLRPFYSNMGILPQALNSFARSLSVAGKLIVIYG